MTWFASVDLQQAADVGGWDQESAPNADCWHVASCDRVVERLRVDTEQWCGLEYGDCCSAVEVLGECWRVVHGSPFRSRSYSAIVGEIGKDRESIDP